MFFSWGDEKKPQRLWYQFTVDVDSLDYSIPDINQDQYWELSVTPPYTDVQ